MRLPPSLENLSVIYSLVQLPRFFNLSARRGFRERYTACRLYLGGSEYYFANLGYKAYVLLYLSRHSPLI